MKLKFLIIDDSPWLTAKCIVLLRELYPTAVFVKARTIHTIRYMKTMIRDLDCLILNLDRRSKENLYEIKTNIDHIVWFRREFSTVNIAMIIASEEALIVYRFHQNIYPDGLFNKQDLNLDFFREGMKQILNGKRCYSLKVIKTMDLMAKNEIMMQYYNLQILIDLNQGYKIHEISERLAISTAAVYMRVAKIKKLFKVTDISGLKREIKKQGYI